MAKNAPLARRVYRDTQSMEKLAFDRAIKEATYYLDEVERGLVAVEFKNFVHDALSRRLQYDDGWLTFDGKKLAHIKDAQP